MTRDLAEIAAPGHTAIVTQECQGGRRRPGRGTGRARRGGNKACRVVVPRDAVAGTPTGYADTIIDDMLSLPASITTTDELIETWKKLRA